MSSPKFFTVNHSLHTLHAVKPGSITEQKLAEKSIGERLTMYVAGDRHSVFETPEEARSFLVLLSLHGTQS